ncbi:hypothetical protein GGR57DRAFT_521034 [Xylariaceae sp. FL1272]|nr:hypothetical protein GGR57DRAFT_521034 [Xylariaceae sp. FL1272]
MAAITPPSLVTFGSLGPLPTEDQVLRLQREFSEKSSLFKPLVDTIHNLDSLWAKLLDQDPKLNAIDGRGAIQKLEGILTGAIKEPIHDDLRNIIIVPMTVLLHVTQYISFIEHSRTVDHSSVLQNVTCKGGIQGLCAGLLSAQTVASAASVGDIIALWCTSITLAFCIGAYVDVNQVDEGGQAASVTGFVHFEPPAAMAHIQKILSTYEDVYIAAIRDEQDLILTAPAAAAMSIRQDLALHGASFHEFDLPGRYHTPIHREVPPKIITACDGLLDPRFGRTELVRSNTDGHVISHQNAVAEVLEAILARSVNWVKTFRTSAQFVDTASEDSYILSVGGDSIIKSVTETHHIVRI